MYEANELEEPKTVRFPTDDKEDVNQIFIITSPRSPNGWMALPTLPLSKAIYYLP